MFKPPGGPGGDMGGEHPDDSGEGLEAERTDSDQPESYDNDMEADGGIEKELSPEEKEKLKQLAHVTSVLLSSFGKIREGEEAERTRIAIREAHETIRLIEEQEISLPTELFGQMLQIVSRLKEKTGDNFALDDNLIDIFIVNLRERDERFENVPTAFKEKRYPAFIEGKMQKALGGKRRFKDEVAEVLADPLDGTGAEEISAAIGELRKGLTVLRFVQHEGWTMDPEYAETAPSQTQVVLEMLDESGFSRVEIAKKPLSIKFVFELLGFEDLSAEIWLSMDPHEKDRVVEIMEAIAQKYAANLQVNAIGLPIVTVDDTENYQQENDED